MPNTRLNAKRNEMSELNPQTTAISRIGMRQTALRKCVKLPRGTCGVTQNMLQSTHENCL